MTTLSKKKDNTLRMLKPEDWNKISINTYKEIYEEARKRHDDLMNESQFVTDRSIKLTLLLFGLAAWASSLFAKNHDSYLLIIISGLYFLCLFWMLLKLLFPKPVTLRGTSPYIIFGNESLIDKNDSDEEREKTFFYYQIDRYAKRIEKMKIINEERAKKYKLALIASFFLVIGVTALFFYRVTHS